MKTVTRTIVLRVFAACVILLPAAPASPAEPLYYIVSPADDAQLLAAGFRAWTRFSMDGVEAAVVSATAGQDRAPVHLGARWGAIPEPAPGEQLFIVTARGGLDPAAVSARGTVLIGDGRAALLIARQEDADALAAEGMELKAVLPPRRPAPAPARVAAPARALAWDARVQEIVDSVTQADVNAMIGNLSGVTSVTIGGSAYTILTRYTYEAIPIEKATQYCYEYLEGLGLDMSYHTYTRGGQTLRNVIGEQAGHASPESIYIACAHLDDVPHSFAAPGADDNASGSTGVLLMASIMSAHSFGNTIRYVLFTGEEQGLWGSYYYAGDCAAAGDQILGVINLDMIAYDGDADGRVEVHCGMTAASGVLGTLLIDTIGAYSLPLAPVKFTAGSETGSDHSRFWDEGFPAILGIEDTDDDFNPYYHSVNDTRAHCNLSYATNCVKAAAGAMAHLGGIVDAIPTPTPTPSPTPTPRWGWVSFGPLRDASPMGFYQDDGSPFGANDDYGWR